MIVHQIQPSSTTLIKRGVVVNTDTFPRGKDKNAWRNLWRPGWKHNFAVWDIRTVRGNVSVKWHEIITRTERAGVPRMNFYRLLHCHSYLQTEWNKRVCHVLAFIYSLLLACITSYIEEERGCSLYSIVFPMEEWIPLVCERLYILKDVKTRFWFGGGEFNLEL